MTVPLEFAMFQSPKASDSSGSDTGGFSLDFIDFISPSLFLDLQLAILCRIRVRRLLLLATQALVIDLCCFYRKISIEICLSSRKQIVSD